MIYELNSCPMIVFRLNNVWMSICMKKRGQKHYMKHLCATSCGQKTAGGKRGQSIWHSAKREEHVTSVDRYNCTLYCLCFSHKKPTLFSCFFHPPPLRFSPLPAHPANSPLALSPFPLSSFWCVCLHGFWALSNSIWPQQRRRRSEKNHFHMCKLGTPPNPTSIHKQTQAAHSPLHIDCQGW